MYLLYVSVTAFQGCKWGDFCFICRSETKAFYPFNEGLYNAIVIASF